MVAAICGALEGTTGIQGVHDIRTRKIAAMIVVDAHLSSSSRWSAMQCARHRGDRTHACSIAHLVAWSASGSDETARALAFAVRVVSHLTPIHVNRTWSRHRDSTRPWNAAFGWIASATCVLLVLVLWVPAISGLFLFTTPSTPLLLIGSAHCLGVLAWFEAAKWLVGQRAR